MLEFQVLSQPYIHDTLKKIHREFMTHGGLARSIYRQRRSSRVCADDLTVLSYNQQFLHERSPRAQIIILISHHPQRRRSPGAQLILNLIPMHVHNIISKEKDDDPSQSNINIICNNLSYHNYMCSLKNTTTTKEIKH